MYHSQSSLETRCINFHECQSAVIHHYYDMLCHCTHSLDRGVEWSLLSPCTSLTPHGIFTNHVNQPCQGFGPKNTKAKYLQCILVQENKRMCCFLQVELWMGGGKRQGFISELINTLGGLEGVPSLAYMPGEVHLTTAS